MWHIYRFLPALIILSPGLIMTFAAKKLVELSKLAPGVPSKILKIDFLFFFLICKTSVTLFESVSHFSDS